MSEVPYKFAVIEDIPSTNNDIKNYLIKRWRSCNVDQYFDYESAINAVSISTFDVVISDVMLGPGSDRLAGIKIAKELNLKRTPVIIVSALTKPEIYSEIFEALGAWDYLEKPVIEESLIKQVELALDYRNGLLEREMKELLSSSVNKFDPDLIIDYSSKIKVTWKNQRVRLSLTQTRLVELLARNPNIPIKYTTMFEKIESGQNIENLRVHVMAIREAFKEVDPKFDRISSVTLTGYIWNT